MGCRCGLGAAILNRMVEKGLSVKVKSEEKLKCKK